MTLLDWASQNPGLAILGALFGLWALGIVCQMIVILVRGHKNEVD